MQVHVRRQGRVCTVFLDDGERPQPLRSAEDMPVGAFPFTAGEAQIRARYPGAELVFHDEVRPPQPEAPQLSEAEQAILDAKIAKILRDEAPPASAAPQRSPKATQIAPAAPPEPSAMQLAAHLLSEFETLVRTMPSDAEAVGSFLLNAFPALEDGLKEAATRAKAPKERKRFSLE